MRSLLPLLILLFSEPSFSQELFVISKPASTIPARSANLKLTGHFVSSNKVFDRPAQRYMPELMLGLFKNIMVQVGMTFSNMHTGSFKHESYYAHARYRFLSVDDVHKHFRMAVFGQASRTKAPFHYDEVGLMGDKTGIELGIITTQLWNRFALSGTLSHVQLLDKSRYDDIVYIPQRIYKVVNYALASGYLVLPKEYTSYKQVNINLYLELLGQYALQKARHFIDMAPAIQLIFFSNTKLNAAYRFQMTGNAERMSQNSWMISIEGSFLSLWRNKSK